MAFFFLYFYMVFPLCLGLNLFTLKKMYLLFYFGCAESLLRYAGFSLQQLLLLGSTGPVFVTHGLNFPTRNWTHVPCIGRWRLNHWTAREVLLLLTRTQIIPGYSLSQLPHKVKIKLNYLQIDSYPKGLRVRTSMLNFRSTQLSS